AGRGEGKEEDGGSTRSAEHRAQVLAHTGSTSKIPALSVTRHRCPPHGMDNARDAWERPGHVRRLVPSRVAAALSVAALVASGHARADDATDAEAIYHRAEADDAAGAYARAMDEYRASVARLPSHRYA